MVTTVKAIWDIIVPVLITHLHRSSRTSENKIKTQLTTRPVKEKERNGRAGAQAAQRSIQHEVEEGSGGEVRKTQGHSPGGYADPPPALLSRPLDSAEPVLASPLPCRRPRSGPGLTSISAPCMLQTRW
jgi:hypothetical protein